MHTISRHHFHHSCSLDSCCKKRTCESFSITGCSLRTSAEQITCALTGCTQEQCCGTCARDGDASLCPTRELVEGRVCPSDGCKPASCCVTGNPTPYRVAVDVVGLPTDADGGRAALASALGVPVGAISDVKYIPGVNGTSRLSGNLTRSSHNPDGSARVPADLAADLQKKGQTDIVTTNNTWIQVGIVPKALVVYPEGNGYPNKCVTGPSTQSIVCEGNGQYGCPLIVTCERGRTPCCADQDGSCDDGDDAIACVDYPKCHSSTSAAARVCGASNFYGCESGVTCQKPTDSVWPILMNLFEYFTQTLTLPSTTGLLLRQRRFLHRRRRRCLLPAPHAR